jgi:hypothetical protein
LHCQLVTLIEGSKSDGWLLIGWDYSDSYRHHYHHHHLLWFHCWEP